MFAFDSLCLGQVPLPFCLQVFELSKVSGVGGGGGTRNKGIFLRPTQTGYTTIAWPLRGKGET